MRTFNLCFLGFGNVGQALVRLLLQKGPEMSEAYGIGWRITGIATRRMGWIASPEGLDAEEVLAGRIGPSIPTESSNVREWLRVALPDVLFETTSLEPHTGQPAIDHIRAALGSGAHAITANKGTLVYAFNELAELAKAQGRKFMFEAAVADCLPVFSLFREALPVAQLLGFKGVFNSTTSIIIEEIERGGTFEDGVRRAQGLGITETDPAFDVDGWDATVKVCAVANVLMKARLTPDQVEREGIRNLDARAVRAARREGRPYKLVSRASWAEDQTRIIATVRPEQIALTDPLGTVSGTTLMMHFNLDVIEGITMTAHNPDLQSTSYGLLADFINAVRE